MDTTYNWRGKMTNNPHPASIVFLISPSSIFFLFFISEDKFRTEGVRVAGGWQEARIQFSINNRNRDIFPLVFFHSKIKPKEKK